MFFSSGAPVATSSSSIGSLMTTRLAARAFGVGSIDGGGGSFHASLSKTALMDDFEKKRVFDRAHTFFCRTLIHAFSRIFFQNHFFSPPLPPLAIE